MRFSRPPTAVIPSTRKSASWPFTTFATSAVGFVSPVEVSFQHKVTARYSCESKAAATVAGSTAVPQSNVSAVGVTKTWHRSWNRSLNFPFTRFSTRSSFRRRPDTAASSPAVPDPERTATGPCVPKAYCVSVRISARASLNSGPRWFIAGTAIASITRACIFTGPGSRNAPVGGATIAATKVRAPDKGIRCPCDAGGA